MVRVRVRVGARVGIGLESGKLGVMDTIMIKLLMHYTLPRVRWRYLRCCDSDYSLPSL